MIVWFQSWRHTYNIQEPIVWKITVKGSHGVFWREVPFTVMRVVDGGTELDNLKKLFSILRTVGTDINDLSVPEAARAVLYDSVDRNGKPLKHYHLWGALVRFTPAPSNDVTLRAREGMTLTVPWE